MKKITELLISAGNTPTLAKVTTFFILSKGAEVSSREIEREEDLRQPEVSLALTKLIEKKWIVDIGEKTAGPTGRPSKKYKVQYGNLLDDLAKSMEQDVNKWKDLIKEIRAMMVVKESVQPETPHVLGKQQSLDHLSL